MTSVTGAEGLAIGAGKVVTWGEGRLAQRALNQAAQRLGVNLSKVQIQDGVARVPVGFAQTLNRADLQALSAYLRHRGATSVRIEAMVQHPRLSEMLLNPRARRILLGQKSEVKVLGEVKLGNTTERHIEIIIDPLK
jgi:hypothetical protein